MALSGNHSGLCRMLYVEDINVMNKKLEVVDFLRGIAIFTIAMMHLVQGSLEGVLNKAASFGGAGVHVFILCSGFGLYLSHLRKPLGYGEFLKKRFAKVYWPYAVAVVAWVAWFFVRSGELSWREGLSHLLLYKMFSTELDVSLCYPFWFISTIVQFYICWPLIVRLARVGGGNLRLTDDGLWIKDSADAITWKGLLISGLISLAWATVVGLLGYEDMRPWGSCFLQYLWEFVLGMWFAEKYADPLSSPLRHAQDNACLGGRPSVKGILENPNNLKWWWLLAGVVVGMGLTGVMGWIGGVLKLYNDIPSLMGYLGLLLIVYKASCTFGWLSGIKKFFVWASGFGYELYLVHSLAYSIIIYFTKDILPLGVQLAVCAVGAYVTGWCYHEVIKRIR